MLGAWAAAAPDARVLCDPPGCEALFGRRPRSWNAGAARDRTAALAGILRRLPLAPGSPIGLCLAGTDAVLALLAAEAAGLLPVLLPLTGDWTAIARAIERHAIPAIVTQTRLGTMRPAARLTEIAARYYGLRFLLAFGPETPDGFVDLEARDGGDGAPSPMPIRAPAPGIVTFADAACERPVFRPTPSLLAATAPILAATGLRTGHRLLTLLAPDDLKGLATGLAAALLARATLEPHAVFDAAALLRALDGTEPLHLVAPGWIEPQIRAVAPSDRLAAIVFVRAAPARYDHAPRFGRRVVDALAFGESAIMAAIRSPDGTPALRLPPVAPDAAGFLTLEMDARRMIAVGGPAAAAAPWRPDPNHDDASGWHGSCYRAEVVAGRLVGVTIETGQELRSGGDVLPAAGMWGT